MPTIIRFESVEDHTKAVGILSEAEETYHGVEREAIIISAAALRLLQTENVRFRVIGGQIPPEPRREQP